MAKAKQRQKPIAHMTREELDARAASLADENGQVAVVACAKGDVVDNGVHHPPGERFMMEHTLVGVHVAAGQVRFAEAAEAAVAADAG